MIRFGMAAGLFSALVAPALVCADDRVIPFTTWQAEQQAIVRGLPCKWVSMNGTYAGGRYDFLCKGGTWATVSLFMDKSDGVADGVGRIRLHYVDWNPKVHPSAGEAFVAQKFLGFVVDRFVPGSAAPSVLEAFWREGGRSWSGSGVQVSYSFDDQKDFNIHKLEIRGVGKSLVGIGGVATREVTSGVTPSDAGLLKTPQGVEWSAQPTPPAGPVRWTSSTVSVAPVPLPAPQEFGRSEPVPQILPPGGLPVATQDSSTLEKAKAALRGMLGQEQVPPLDRAHPSELDTSPAPESLARPAPLPGVSPSLVPDADEIANGPKAPSNFDAYNRATELTRDIEKRANTQVILPNKVVPVDEARKLLAVSPTAARPAPLAAPGPSLPATPTPGLDSEPNSDATVPGSGRPVRLSPEELESGGLGTYDPMNPQRSRQVRPLPQLQFIPRAEPLKGDEVIRFEDEGSKL